MTEQRKTSTEEQASRLSALEKQALKQMIDRGEKLPERYRHILFGQPRFPELVWQGKHREQTFSGNRFTAAESYGAKMPAPAENDGGEAQSGPGTGQNPSLRAARLWRGKLFWGDNKDAMAALSEAPLRRGIEAAGGIRLIYIDPPFDVGADFDCVLPVGDDPANGARKVKARAYRDSWGGGGPHYLSMMYGRLRQMHGLLAEDGSLYLHCDWRSSSALRLMLDEIFGREAFVNEIVWHYYNKYSASRHCLPRAHDTIWVYSKSGKHILNALREPRDTPQRQLVRENVGGTLKNARDSEGKLRYRMVTDRKCDDVWRIPQLQPASQEWSGYGTQKHHDLLERIILTGSNPGDIVADFFSGSGTALAVAQRLGRGWIGCDSGQLAIHTTRKRLLTHGRADCAAEFPAFDVLYSNAPRPRLQSLAEPEPPGRVSAHPAPPTAEAGLPVYTADFAVEIAVDFPVEVGASGPEISVNLTDFSPIARQGYEKDQRLIVRDGGLIERIAGSGGRIRQTVLTRTWTDWVDYWAVDFTYGERCIPGGAAPFCPGWRSFRTYKSRAIEFRSPAHAYDGPGHRTIAVQVVDIFGNCWLKLVEFPGE